MKEDFLFLKWTFNDLNISRFGFIVSKKISTKANLRNKIKRRLSELIRLKLPTIKRGVDGILIARAGLEKKDFKQIEKTLDKILTKTTICKW